MHPDNFSPSQRAPCTMRFYFGAKVTSIALASIDPTRYAPMSTLLSASSRSTVFVLATLDLAGPIGIGERSRFSSRAHA
jgi:hypothetical protein